MANYENLPGIITELQDGNLDVLKVLEAPVVLVIGTASKGPSERVMVVSRPDEAKVIFGTSGTLSRGVVEAAMLGAKSVVGYRIGATSAKLEHIGDTAGVDGITIETVAADDEIGDEFFISWDDGSGVLKVWDVDGILVYSNDPSTGTIDAGQLIVSGSADGVTGGSFGDGTFAGSVQMSLLDAGTPVTGVAGLDFTVGTDGLNPTRERLYELLQDAYRALETAAVDIVTVMDVYLDDANIADDDTLAGQEGVEDALYWFKETESAIGLFTYAWDDSASKPADYHEVNFAYQLANFCYNLSKNDNNAIGVIGVRPYASLAISDIYAWVGALPTLDSTTGEVTVNGSGLLGNKFMAGTLTFDKGFYATAEEHLDGDTGLVDDNDHAVDIGKYLSIVASWPILSNTFDTSGYGYVSSGAPLYAGLISTLESKSAPTNKALSRSVGLPFKLPKKKLDQLVGVKYVVFSTKTQGSFVVDAPTAAMSTSDYQRLTTIRIVNDATDAVRRVADPFIGEAQTTATRQAMQATIERELSNMQKFGFLRRYDVTVTATANQQIRGEATVTMVLVPAFELRRIRVTVSLARE